MGYDWPAELLAWLRVGDGAHRTIHADVILGFIPMGVAQIVDEWRLMREVINTGEWLEPGEVEASEAGEAGTYSGVWCRTFIPVGDYTTGDFLFIDLRSGPLHGCIREWEDGAAYPREPHWDGIASMLSDIDQALQTGQLLDEGTGKIPTVKDGALEWEYPEVSPGPEPEPLPLHDLRILLLLDKRRNDADVAQSLGISPEVVRKWRSRFIENVSIFDWPEFAARFPVGSTAAGVVFSHHPFGIYVDLGIPFPGSVAADHLPPGPYPPIGSEIRAVVVRQEQGQLHLDGRPFADE